MLREEHNTKFGTNFGPNDTVFCAGVGSDPSKNHYDPLCSACWHDHGHTWATHDERLLQERRNPYSVISLYLGYGRGGWIEDDKAHLDAEQLQQAGIAGKEAQIWVYQELSIGKRKGFVWLLYQDDTLGWKAVHPDSDMHEALESVDPTITVEGCYQEVRRQAWNQSLFGEADLPEGIF